MSQEHVNRHSSEMAEALSALKIHIAKMKAMTPLTAQEIQFSKKVVPLQEKTVEAVKSTTTPTHKINPNEIELSASDILLGKIAYSLHAPYTLQDLQKCLKTDFSFAKILLDAKTTPHRITATIQEVTFIFEPVTITGSTSMSLVHISRNINGKISTRKHVTINRLGKEMYGLACEKE